MGRGGSHTLLELLVFLRKGLQLLLDFRHSVNGVKQVEISDNSYGAKE